MSDFSVLHKEKGKEKVFQKVIKYDILKYFAKN